MVSVRADAITLSIDNSFSMKLDSSLLLTNKSHQIFLAVARLDEDAFFLTVNLKYSPTDNIVQWEINPIVKPLISQITIRPDNEETPQSYVQNSMLATTKGEHDQPHSIVLTPGQSQNITEDIVVHLLSRSYWSDMERGGENARPDSHDRFFADRYHILSSWPVASGTENEVWEDEDLSRESSHNELPVPHKTEKVSYGTKPVNFSDTSPRYATLREWVEYEALSNSLESHLDDEHDTETVAEDLGQSNWLRDLREVLWDILAVTTSALLDSFPSVSTGSD